MLNVEGMHEWQTWSTEKLSNLPKVSSIFIANMWTVSPHIKDNIQGSYSSMYLMS